MDAAEEVFAQNGFAGARIETIAKASGYNTGLIFRYFGDKLGLYSEVLKRSDSEVSELMVNAFTPLFTDEAAASDADHFRAFLKGMIVTLFDYLLDHPSLVRILTWEMAGGWEMLAKTASQFPTENSERFVAFFHKAWTTGFLRSNFAFKIQFSLVMQICHVYLAYLPLYQMLLPGEDPAATGSMAQAREHLVNFIVAGMMTEPEIAEETT